MEVSHSFDAYQAAFYEYAGRFDSSDGRVALKIVHTDAVVAIMKRLCSMRKLPKHTESLALLCALFHDIGRFEQLKQYDTFLDHKSVDHAALSCQVLKENQILAALPAPDQEMILTAIANHNRLEIDENSVSGQEGMTLCRLLRDADKCDIFRVFATDDMTDVIGVPDEIPAGETVSPSVLSAVREHRCVDKRIRETHLDFWISFLSFFFDLNYPESAAIAKEQGYYRVPFDRVTFTDPVGKKQVQEILTIIEDYLRSFPAAEASSAPAPLTAQPYLSLTAQPAVPETCVPKALSAFFKDHPKMALAFSGGTDSAYLLYAAKACGCDVRAYYVETSFQPEFEREDARRLAKELGADMKTLPLNILALDSVRNNPKDRCYSCKNAIFHEILKAAADDGFSCVMDGTNASDDAGDRPGMRALRELKVFSPLRLCGITKKALREYSRNAGLFTWDKPAYACLATRIPSGTFIDEEILARIEWAEGQLANLGFSDFRVRAAELPDPDANASRIPDPDANASKTPDPDASASGIPASGAPDSGVPHSGTSKRNWAARLQITKDQLPLLLEHRSQILELLKTRFSQVSLDLELRAPSR